MKLVKISDLNEEERKKAFEEQQKRLEENRRISEQNRINANNQFNELINRTGAFDTNNHTTNFYNITNAMKSSGASKQSINNFKKNNHISLWDNILDIMNGTGKAVENTWLGFNNGIKSFQQTLGKRMTETQQNRVDFWNEENKKMLEQRVKTHPEEENQIKQAINNPLVTGEQLREGEKKISEKIQSKKERNLQKINKNIEEIDNPVMKKIAEISPSIGQMAPAFATGGMGAIYMAGSSTGQYYDDAKQRGMSDEEAKTYSGIMGLMEGATEMIGINNLSKAGKGLKELVKGTGKEVAKETTEKVSKSTVKEVLKDYGIGIADNMIQEALIDPIDEVVSYSVSGKTKHDYSKVEGWKQLGNDMLQDAINGGLVGAILGGANLGIQSCNGLVQKYNSRQEITSEEFKTAVKDASKELDIGEMIKQNVQQEVGKYSKQNESNIIDTKGMTFEESASANNIDINNETIKTVSQVLSNRDIAGRFDSSYFKNNNENAIWRTYKDEEGKIKREVIFNPNGDSQNTMQQISIHELTHDLVGTKEYEELKNLVLDKNKTREGYEEARQSLESTYSQVYDSNSENFRSLVDDEEVADTLAQKLGDQDFINSLNVEKPNVFKRIYNWVVNKVNKITGNKIEKLYWEDIKNKFKSAYSQEYKGTESQEKFSFVGQNGIKNAVQQEPLKYISVERRLNKAKQMQQTGIDNESIRQNTGWFQDKNGDWKFEISDKNMKIKNNVKLKENTSYKLGEIIEHDALFTMYPALKNVDVEFTDMKGIHGNYNIKKNKIKLNNSLTNNNKQIESTLIHEMQHTIQDIEGFELGASSKISKKAYFESLGEIEADNTKQRFIKEKYKNIDIGKIAPESSKANPKHRGYNNYMENRGTIDKMKDTMFKYPKKGGNSNEFNQESLEQNSNENLREVRRETWNSGNTGFQRHRGNGERGIGKKEQRSGEIIQNEEIANTNKSKKESENNSDSFNLAQDKTLNVPTKQLTKEQRKNKLEYLKSIDTSNMKLLDKSKIKSEIRALENGYNSVEEMRKVEKEQEQKAIQEYRSKQNQKNKAQKDTIKNNSNKLSNKSLKELQLDIIQKYNPMLDDLHTGIRTIDDIKTFGEALQDSDWEGWEESGFDPDYDGNMAKKALKTGKITIYSSYPIKQGTFVTPSYMEAESYSGNGKVYSKKVNLEDVAWIEPTQGQYAKVNNTKASEKQEVNKIKQDGSITMTYVRNANTNTQNYGSRYGQNIEPAGEYMSMDTMQGKYKIPGFEYGSIDFKKPLILDHKDTTANGWKKDLSKKYGGLTGKKLSEAIKKDGYDAIMTKDEEGNFIEVVNINGKKNNNLNTRASIGESGAWQSFLENQIGPTGKGKTVQELRLPTKETIKSKINLPTKENINTQGEKINWNDIEKPKGKIRKHYTSIIESSNTTKEAKAIAKELMGADTYIPETNKGQLEQADYRINNSSPESELESLMSRTIQGEKINSVDIAVGERLIQYYSKIGDKNNLQDAIQATAMAGTSAGQTVQALAMLNHQTPQGQAIWIQRSVDKMNNELARKKGGFIKEDEAGNIKVINKAGKDITDKVNLFNLTSDMLEKIVKSANKNEMYKNIDLVYEELGQQVPLSTIEKIDSWRYFSMLANPKTHIRNMLGNFAMGKTQGVKNKLAGAIEDIVGTFNKDMERTKTLRFADKKTKQFAKEDVLNSDVQSMMELNENKYNPQSRLQNARKTFKNDMLENTVGRLFNWNDKLLEAEDAVGLKSNYKKALQNYLVANKIDVDNMTDAQLSKARNYAVEQAKEATFHQANAIATAINQISSRNKVAKGIKDATLPFVKTPLNVAKAGVEYNPVGLLKTIVYDSVKLRKGEITVNKYIDNLAKGLTGTGVAVLGYALADGGILKASGSDDDKKEKYDEELGNQTYSIRIGDKTYSLDWLSPVGIPLFVGAELKALKDSSVKENNSISTDDDEKFNQAVKSFENLANAMANSMSPMSEMSMISGLTSALKSYDQDSTKMLATMGTNAIKSYVNQFVPTILGQMARTTDDYERTTTSTKTGVLTKAVDQTKLQVMSKIPGLRQKLPTKSDIWGAEKQSDPNISARIINNFINPATVKDVNVSEVDKELNNLYDKIGESSILPSSIEKTYKINGQTYRMTNKEFSEYKKSYGQTSYKLLDDLIKTKEYEGLSDDQKQKAVESIYEYAKESNKIKYAKENNLEIKSSTLYKTLEELKQKGGKQSAYLTYLVKTKDISGEDSSKKKIQVLANSNYTNITKEIIYKNTEGNKDKKIIVVDKLGLPINQYLRYKSQKFESDKDKDGETVKGSKNQKVYDYLDGILDRDLSQDYKKIICKIEGINKYDNDIVNTINKNSKLSPKDRVEILTNIGFKIDKNGRIQTKSIIPITKYVK